MGCCKGNRQGESRAALLMKKVKNKRNKSIQVDKTATLGGLVKPIEADFIRYLSETRKEPKEKLLSNYLTIKKEFGTPSRQFKKFREAIVRMNSAVFGFGKASDLMSYYNALEGWWMLRFLSYESNPEYLRLLEVFPEKVKTSLGRWPETILDYGCGVSHWAYQIVKTSGTKPKVYLLDIPGISRDFGKWRLERMGCRVEIINVTMENPNPKPLPMVDLCVVWSVLEHLLDPIGAIKNIMNSINDGGILYAFLGEWKPESLHVNARSREVMDLILSKFDDQGGWIYKNKNS